MTIIPARPAHVPLVESCVTAEGARELSEVYGLTPHESLRRNLAASSEAWTMFAGEDALCMFGVAPLSILESHGEFWIVGTTHICRHRLAFARSCRLFLPRLLQNWSMLSGTLEHQRQDVVRWARWLGVEITPIDARLSGMRLCRKLPES
jgi:hypothetical protein